MAPQVWLITGTSSGFGRFLTQAALKHGDKVIATARDPRKIEDLKALGAATLALDVVDSEENIKEIISDAISIYGKIDILVNNAGYLIQGTVEESSGQEVQQIFDTNVFGPLKIIRAILPHMRQRKSGMIANIGSVGGWQGGAGASLYCATKWALAAITVSLRPEVALHGIDAVIIEPGYFRTPILATGHRLKSAMHIPDYDEVMDPLRGVYDTISLKQPGDPEKGAQAMVEILTKSGAAAGKTLTTRIPLGSDALGYIDKELKGAAIMLDTWKEFAASTDYVE